MQCINKLYLCSYFKWRILTFTRSNWKCNVIIVIKTDLMELVVALHWRLCEQYPRTFWQQPHTPSTKLRCTSLSRSYMIMSYECMRYVHPHLPGLNRWHWLNHVISPMPINNPLRISVNVWYQSTIKHTKYEIYGYFLCHTSTEIQVLIWKEYTA